MRNGNDSKSSERDEALAPNDPSAWARMSPNVITASIDRALEEAGDQSEDLRWLEAASRVAFRRMEEDEIEGGWPTWRLEPKR
jgi:hypothetical protein